MNPLVPLRVLSGIIRVVHSAFDSPERQEKRRTAKELRHARHLVISVQESFPFLPFTLSAGKSYKLLLGIVRQFAPGQLALPQKKPISILQAGGALCLRTPMRERFPVAIFLK
jgi:hypothetical protein